MQDKKFKRAILLIKVWLVIMLISQIPVHYNDFVAGLTDGLDNNSKSVSSLKQIIKVDQLKDSVLFKVDGYSINAIKAFQVQQTSGFINPSTSPSSNYSLWIHIVAFLLGLFSIYLLVIFIKSAFKLLNKLEKLVIADNENVKLLNTLSRYLAVFCIVDSVSNYMYDSLLANSVKIPGYTTVTHFSINQAFIATSILLTLLAWIVKYLTELKKEQDLTI